MPAAFAMQARLHMERYGTTLEQMAMVAVKNRRNALLNPRCHMKQEVTVEEVLASPSDRRSADATVLLPQLGRGGGRDPRLRGGCAAHTDRPVRIAASVLVSGVRTPHGIVDDKSEMSVRAAAQGIRDRRRWSRTTSTCARLHDPFTIAEIIHYEDLGFCKPGEGGRFVAEGRSAIGGDVAVSPSGGLLAKGHPLGATGVAQIAELFWQLRGEAGGYQVPGAKVGLAHTVGGGVSKLEAGACGVHILTI